MLEFRIVYCSFVFNLESESGCLNVFSEAYSVVVYMWIVLLWFSFYSMIVIMWSNVFLILLSCDILFMFFTKLMQRKDWIFGEFNSFMLNLSELSVHSTICFSSVYFHVPEIQLKMNSRDMILFFCQGLHGHMFKWEILNFIISITWFFSDPPAELGIFESRVYYYSLIRASMRIVFISFSAIDGARVSSPLILISEHVY